MMIRLLNDYYRIERWAVENDDTLFDITLLPEYRAYTGHFPDNPVSPGVCNIQMIKECAESVTNMRLFLNRIAKCRFSAVLTPQTASNLRLRLQLTEADTISKVYQSGTGQTYHAVALLFDDTTTYIDFKGDFNTVL